jgi:hypothetical protein
MSPAISPLTIQLDHSRRATRTLEIAMSYARGTPIADISSRYEISSSQILRIARQYNLPKRPKHFDPAIKDKVLTMCRAHKPLAEISALLGVSQAYISKTGKEAGLARYKGAAR